MTYWLTLNSIVGNKVTVTCGFGSGLNTFYLDDIPVSSGSGARTVTLTVPVGSHRISLLCTGTVSQPCNVTTEYIDIIIYPPVVISNLEVVRNPTTNQVIVTWSQDKTGNISMTVDGSLVFESISFPAGTNTWPIGMVLSPTIPHTICVVPA